MIPEFMRTKYSAANKKMISFMCTKCHCIDKKLTYTSTFMMHVDDFLSLSEDDLYTFEQAISPDPWNLEMYCDDCYEETEHVIIDTEIARVISYLNKAGIESNYSCSGHLSTDGDYNLPYISFNPTNGMKLLALIDLHDKEFSDYFRIEAMYKGDDGNEDQDMYTFYTLLPDETWEDLLKYQKVHGELYSISIYAKDDITLINFSDHTYCEALETYIISKFQ